MTRHPVAYIRRSSRSKADPGDVSRDFQVETVRTLANDANLVILDGDWGVSAATESTAKRLAFLDLLRAIEAGEVSTLYAYSTDRLARSVRWAAQLLDLCEAAGVTIVTSEGRFAPGDDMARQMFQFAAVTNEAYSRQQKRKRASTIQRQRASGKKLGAPYYGALPGEDLAAVIDAYERIGSMHGAARELNRLGVPSRRGHWAITSVHRILAREGLVPEHGQRGARHRNPHLFSRLLLCHCGHLLTGSKRSDGRTVYRCIRGEASWDHERKEIAERQVLPWAAAEVARLRPPTDTVSMVDVEREHHAITERVEKLADAFLAGIIDKDRMLAEKEQADAALMRLELQSQAVRVPEFSWNREPYEVNLALRALWSHVVLGPDLRPMHAEWLLPASWIAEAAP